VWVLCQDNTALVDQERVVDATSAELRGMVISGASPTEEYRYEITTSRAVARRYLREEALAVWDHLVARAGGLLHIFICSITMSRSVINRQQNEWYQNQYRHRYTSLPLHTPKRHAKSNPNPKRNITITTPYTQANYSVYHN